MAIRGVHHVALTTKNIDRLVNFYKDALGFEVVFEGGWDKGSDLIDEIVGLKGSSAKQAMLKAGNAYIEVFEYVTPEGEAMDPKRPVNNQGYTHFCLDVVDIDKEYERLLAAGMTFHRPPPTKDDFGGGPIRATYGRDPDGNVIEIQEISDRDHAFYLDAD
ncbi:MAG: VOC family protein [Alphaproteobacteria bacterium]|nr:VOC family protein [Alphaproteobacteria bacterium]